MRFEWNEEKNQRNFEKHGIWFEEAQTIWADRHAVEFYDPEHSENENRYIRIGYASSRERLLLVVFCERNNGKTIRLISARKATKNERFQYEEGI